MGPPGQRDEGWFTSIYASQYPSVVAYGRRCLADPDAAAELAQEVFVIAWRRQADVPDHSLPWLYGVARRLLANHWRARRGTPTILPIADDEHLVGTAGADAAVGVADIHAALALLSDLDQEILRLVGWEELTVAEAARVLGCSRTAAAVRLHRVLADLPRVRWRGEVTDRAGRKGVAVSYDDPVLRKRSVLIFQPRTGELLAEELVSEQYRLTKYILVLASDRTDRPTPRR